MSLKRTRGAGPSGGTYKRRKYTGRQMVMYRAPRTQYSGRYAKGNGETKFFDTTLSGIFGTINATMLSANLNIIVQGNTESNRIGRKVILKRVDCKGALTLPSTTASANTSDMCRLLLVCDKQTNGSAFVGTDLWDTDAWSSFNNLANSSRFRILKSKIYTFNASAGLGIEAAQRYGERVVQFKIGANLNLTLEFDNSATTGAVSTQRSNSLWLVSQSLTANINMGQATSRVRFSDG